MAWIALIVAGFLEVVWAMAMKMSVGFTRLGPSLVNIAGLIASFLLLAYATKELPIGTAYAIWTGIGAVGTVIFGVVLLHETLPPLSFVFLAMIIAGIIGLKWMS